MSRFDPEIEQQIVDLIAEHYVVAKHRREGERALQRLAILVNDVRGRRFPSHRDEISNTRDYLGVRGDDIHREKAERIIAKLKS